MDALRPVDRGRGRDISYKVSAGYPVLSFINRAHKRPCPGAIGLWGQLKDRREDRVGANEDSMPQRYKGPQAACQGRGGCHFEGAFKDRLRRTLPSRKAYHKEDKAERAGGLLPEVTP